MSIQKKSLISTLKMAKKANLASAHDTDAKGAKVSSMRMPTTKATLKATLKSVSANNYIDFFIDAKARADVDGFFTVNYGDYADPAALLATLVLPDGSQNYDAYNNPQVLALMNEARSTADPDQRAQKVADAQKLIVQDMPWIPDVMPDGILVTSANLTGAFASFDYMFAPWANTLGGTG